MKIDRLLGIIFCLLNKDVVSGNYLAKKFEVSKRTIQRDMDTINLAGIPIVSEKGIHGGYKILDTFRLYSTPINQENIRAITLALKSIKTALDDEKIDDAIMKIMPIMKNEDDHIFLDHGIAKENKTNLEYIKQISEAINNKKTLTFYYTNANGHKSQREVEPVCLNYKWYAWYLIGYCRNKQDYRVFKLVRMHNLNIENKSFSNLHVATQSLFDELIHNDKSKSIHVKMQVQKKVCYIIDEYIPKGRYTELDSGELIYDIDFVENEKHWYGIILSLADNVKIIEPTTLINQITHDAHKINNLYKDDI
ncbi:MAG: YafY family transcriptional regulator [Clostridiales bacterium]|nr:YafY family transcriptional regulator [Clostridiales bacterium]